MRSGLSNSRKIINIVNRWAREHSSLNVSLTYLRGLEVAELEESDMPMIL
jgi:hypothetical protein